MNYKNQVTLFIFLFSFCIGNISYSSETSSGRGSSENGSSTGENFSRDPSLEIKANSCPANLANWVNEDFTNQTGVMGLVDFPSEAKTCLSSVKSYEDYVKKSGKKTSLDDSLKLGQYLADRYKQISPSVQEVLSKCSNLPDGKDKVAKTRFYMAATKLEAYNSTVLDEIAYIDSLNPKNQSINSLDCSSIFPFPQVGKKCDEYKKMLNGSCKQSQEDRLKALVKKTKDITAKVDELKLAYKDCRFQRTEEQCQNINIAIQMLVSEAPWIEGKKFQYKNTIAKVNTFWKDDLKDAQIKQGILDQLDENKKAYIKQYSNNLQQMKCLTSTGSSQSNCDIQESRKYISNLPDLVEPASKSTSESREFESHVTAEKCLIDRGIDRADTKRIVNGAATDAAITLSTAGLGAVANGGLKFIKGMSTVSKLKNASLINSTIASMNLSNSAKQAYESCSKASEGLLNYSGKPEVLKENLCPDSTSKFEIAKESYNGCLTDALLTSLDVWPFVKGLKLATKLSKFSNDDLLKLYKDPTQRKQVEEILAKNGVLDEVERSAAAEKLLGRKLSGAEKSCIDDAHNIAPEKYFNISSNVATGLPVLNSSDLRQKSSKLSGCGIVEAEVSLLMRAGITGKTIAVANQEAVLQSYEMAKKLSQKGGSAGTNELLATTSITLKKYDEAEKAYFAAYNIVVKKNGLDSVKSDQAARIINNMSSNEVAQLSEYAAASGKSELIPLIEKRRILDIEKEAKRGFPQTLEGIQQANETGNATTRAYYLTLVEQSRSNIPLIKRMGEERLKAYMKLYPGMR